MIFLIGFMGSGKTTVGKVLAKHLGWSCIDTDLLIEAKNNLTIKEIFERYGEERFREMETEALKELEGEQGVVMTGGGLAAREENRELMKKKGRVVWLNCSFEELSKRIIDDEERPLVTQKGLSGLKSLYEERLTLYKLAADFTIETSHLTVDETVKKVLSCLKTDSRGENNR
jgi:shikimate kinase